MSSRSWSATGYGVQENIFDNVSVETKIEFLEKYLPDIYLEFQKDVENAPIFNKKSNQKQAYFSYKSFCENWIQNYEDAFCNIGFGALFAQAINATEKDFQVSCYQGLYKDENAIVFDPALPWQMSDRVKNMSEEDMYNIFKKYLDDLGLGVFRGEKNIGNHFIEFYG